MTGPAPGGWDGSIAGARRLQAQLATQVRLDDDWPRPLRYLAGLDAGLEDAGRTIRAAAVLLDAHTLAPLARHVVRMPTPMAYVPGLLSFRELPALLAALDTLDVQPDLVFVDGQGIAHPRGLGIAAHLGVVTQLPSIGVAKQPLAVTFTEPGPQPGARSALHQHGRIVGYALRSKARCRPLFVSPGHRVSTRSACALTRHCLAGYRLPEPTRLADRLASRRDPDS